MKTFPGTIFNQVHNVTNGLDFACTKTTQWATHILDSGTQSFSFAGIQPSVARAKLIAHIHCAELLNLQCMKALQSAEEEKETAEKTLHVGHKGKHKAS